MARADDAVCHALAVQLGVRVAASIQRTTDFGDVVLRRAADGTELEFTCRSDERMLIIGINTSIVRSIDDPNVGRALMDQWLNLITIAGSTALGRNVPANDVAHCITEAYRDPSGSFAPPDVGRISYICAQVPGSLTVTVGWNNLD